MVMEAFLPSPGGAASTRVILQAKEVQEKASKIKKDYGDDFFSENEPHSESILAMALKQVVMEKLANFRLEVFSPGSERDFEDWSKPRKVPVDFSISSSDGKLLSALAEAIFSCVIEEIGGPDFVLLAHEFIPSYKLQINAAAFKNTELKGCHELANNRQEVLVSHFQLAELGNVLDMYFEDQFTLPGKTFHSHWNAEPSKIRKNNGYLNNLFAFLAGSSVILIVGVLAQLYWPQSLKDKSLFMEVEKNKEVEKDKEVATEMAKVDVGCMDLLCDLEHSMLESLLLETSLLDYMDYCMDLLNYYV